MPVQYTYENNRYWMGENKANPTQKPDGTDESGDRIEGAVASAFYDIVDTTNGDEVYSTITGGPYFQDFSLIWRAIRDYRPHNIAGYYRGLMSGITTDANGKTRLRGILEYNGLVFSRSHLKYMQTPVTPTDLCEAILYNGQRVVIGEVSPLATPTSTIPPPLSEEPVTINQERIQVMTGTGCVLENTT